MGPDRSLTDQLQSTLGTRPPLLPRPAPLDLQARMLRPIVQRLHAADAHVVLELSCGSGWFTSALERCGFEVTGLDHDEAEVETARLIYPDVRFIEHDPARPLPAHLVGRFDAVVAIAAPGPAAHVERWVAAGAAALKPCATLIVADRAAGRAGWPWFRGWREPMQTAPRHARARLQATLAALGLREVRVDVLGRLPELSRALLGCGRSAG